MYIIWSQFLVCAALITVSGVYLSRYGDVIADKTGLGGTWIGLILLATVTSLPELAAGVSAVTLAQTPNIAIGGILGSCVFNLFLLTILDILQREESVFSRASRGHILAAGFGVLLLGFVGFNLLLGGRGIALEDFKDGFGRVRVHSEEWQARADSPIQRGAHVMVTGRDGLVLVVEPNQGSVQS